ncbi:MAG: BMP family ABC transporter substrate-binding protein [Atopobiaceae bacterium]|jgi:basic membrane lipoprotein Med (substrate-binding protein (PBP1-ABC) superfamily)|nr:BMP family ABC transporter substrate-binding protein [Atopobiaceae bacterium]MCH4180577.1 BMP family ABC transporter substrate-binding protein [Atopobiaceae bacterium]MCH4214302.1 BMP family ABC transporter substrate-binding protein [Atopobiaceae bacterium]MCH4276127.1 BMP family ABC transporter substrate-binding protein [Atopobiaceae bacterium]MCI1227311.1 BMP family ABC transporter substrate-binding protein [Atopobiaceae bacterium]
MSRQEATTQYAHALKEGKRCYQECVRSGRYPYLQVLDEILAGTETQGRVDLGQVEIPIDRIAGTKEAGRETAFAANFMPLLAASTEFGMKWTSLCEAHLGESGIQDPIRAYEYMGRFYVQEGNKRVSVMKSFGAMSITGQVTRIVPMWSDDLETRVYFEYLHFYELSGVCQVHFNGVGGYAKIQAALGFDADHVWSAAERRAFISEYYRFKRAIAPLDLDERQVTCGEALLVWLQVYTLDDLRTMTPAALAASVVAVRKDIEAVGTGGPISVNTEPNSVDQGVVGRIIGSVSSHSVLKVAFVFEASPAESLSVAGHVEGMRHLEQTLESRVRVSAYYASRTVPVEDALAWAAEDGADLLVVTSPNLVMACRKVAAAYPRLRVLDCSVALPYAGVRTFSCREYETSFIAGALAGAMAGSEPVGLIAGVPTMGVPAAVNAFALGVQLVSPATRVLLGWSGAPGDAFDGLLQRGVKVISNCEVPLSAQQQEYEGLCKVDDAGLTTLAVPHLNWGVFYVRLVTSILSGTWDALQAQSGTAAVSYWWGIAAGVIDLEVGPSTPDGPAHLVDLLRDGIATDRVQVFRRRVVRRDGSVFNDGSRWPTTDEVLNMGWLCKGIEGTLPGLDELRPEARELVRVQGVNRADFPPEKGGQLV